jgi:hypothetical protein
MITEDEKRQFLRNEEKLWDMAALTISSSLANHLVDHSKIVKEAYDLADALMAERRKRLAEPVAKTPPCR